MISGAPLLAIYDATGVFRTFELAAGVFTQMASQGGFPQNAQPSGGTYPFFSWAQDQIVVVLSEGGTGRSIRLLSSLLSTLDNEAQTAGASTASYRAGFGKGTQVVSILPGTGNNGTSLRKFRVAPGVLNIESHASPSTALVEITQIPASPDGVKWPQLHTTGIRNVRDPGLNQAWVLDGTLSGVRAAMGAWDASSRYLTVGVPGDTYATVLRYSSGLAAGYEPTQQIDHPNGTFYAIGSDPHGKYLAIGWAVSGGYETRIYKRLGSFYQYQQTLAGMGRLLDFSADGRILVDGASRKIAVFNPGTSLYADDAAMAANLPTGTVAQAVSDHAPVLSATVDMYQAGLTLLAAGTFDMTDLKLTLATSAAPAFDIAHDTLAEVLGSAELTQGGWPAGGVPVENATADSTTPGVVVITGDDVERVIITSSATFRYAVLHQNGTPLARYDFQEDRVVDQNSTAVFDMPSTGLLNLVM